MQIIWDRWDTIYEITSSFGPSRFAHDGWDFLLPSLDYNWTVVPEDEGVAIPPFEDLGARGANGLGVVNQRPVTFP